MSDLSNSIYNYYVRHFWNLPADKQFHFSSRLYLWNQSSQAAGWLSSLRSYFTADSQPALAIERVIDHAKNTQGYGSKNASELRRPFFERYPELKLTLSILFRINFMETVYGLRGHKFCDEYLDTNSVQAMITSLQKDRQALAILSTHAVNLIYLYSAVVDGDVERVDPTLLYNVGQTIYDHADPIQLQLLIYLYTHCVIGESRFYARAISDARRPVYVAMLEYLEQLIDAHFVDINLDNKFEYLVCCRLVGYASNLVERIHDEASRSLSEKGCFVIDRHNTNQQSANITLNTSEHRNVLFILSETPYTPAKPLFH